LNGIIMKREPGDTRTLEILEAIDAQRDVTQRRLADQLGVALGLANSYLRRCVRKGLVKIQQAPANRYFYYLTPQGLAEKSRLTAEYLLSSFDYYHRAGESIGASFVACTAKGYHRLVFAGMSEIAEIASIKAHDYDLEVVGTIDLGATVDRFLGRPVWRSAERAAACDAVLFTALAEPRALLAALLQVVPAERVLVPAIMQPLLEVERATET
jgi:DNA-binding MarR family transcriptional regulator